ncbi:MAG: ImmA/IrrE family metallo-endopeptidase [Bryobacteraceae bacterium]|nr:ImmA/IrrE family metallo-endopeptidase [Bryobacteraceae bacterium]
MTTNLHDILESTKLDPAFCADLLSVSVEQFRDWLNGVRPLPKFVLPELASVLGVNEDSLLGQASQRRLNSDSLAPAIWYKLRNEKLTDADRELVGLIRKLGFYIDQLQAVRQQKVRQWKPLFETIRDSVNTGEPPAVQGRTAAEAFRGALDFGRGHAGIGEQLRPALRRQGVLVVESPIRSQVEGCTFAVGVEDPKTPCLFANSYRSTWFRRNAILLHELAHAILDLDSDPVALDFKDEVQTELSEVRAQAFAQECLVPASLLNRIANRRGIHWNKLEPQDLATLVADTHAEQSLVLRAALQSGYIDEDEAQLYQSFEVDGLVRQQTPHALTTREYLKSIAEKSPKWAAENRNTGVGRRPIRLPVGYVIDVLAAWQTDEISTGKAAEMLMMDKDVFLDRFGETKLAD